MLSFDHWQLSLLMTVAAQSCTYLEVSPSVGSGRFPPRFEAEYAVTTAGITNGSLPFSLNWLYTGDHLSSHLVAILFIFYLTTYVPVSKMLRHHVVNAC